MSTYVRLIGDQVAEVIPPAFYDNNWPDESLRGSEIPIEDRYTPEFVQELRDVTGVDPQPQAGWVFDGTSYAPWSPPPPTAAEILAVNTATRNQMLAAATLAIAPLQDADDLGEATAAESALLKAWKQFRVAVNRIDLTLASPPWPAVPQTGYGAAVAPDTQAAYE